MKVFELIELLVSQDPDAQVIIEGCTQCANDVKAVTSGVFRESGEPWVEIEAVLE